MNTEEIKRLRQFFHSLRGVVPIIEEAKGRTDHYPVQILQEEVGQLLSEFPGIVPPFNPQQFYSHSHEHTSYYDSGGIRAYLSRVIGRLQIAIEEPADTPVTERREFQFIRNADLRRILERDYSEAQRAYIAECWKSVIILSGGMIEAVLADLLLNNQGIAKAATCAPKNPDITRWDLADLINVSVELKLVSPGAEKLSHPIREFRNLIHPGNELRNALAFGQEEARIALEVLNIVYRSLA